MLLRMLPLSIVTLTDHDGVESKHKGHKLLDMAFLSHEPSLETVLLYDMPAARGADDGPSVCPQAARAKGKAPGGPNEAAKLGACRWRLAINARRCMRC